MKDCGGCVNDGTSGGNAKENARCLSDSKDRDEGDEKDGWNDEDGLHSGVVCVCELGALSEFFRDEIVNLPHFPPFVHVCRITESRSCE